MDLAGSLHPPSLSPNHRPALGPPTLDSPSQPRLDALLPLCLGYNLVVPLFFYHQSTQDRTDGFFQPGLPVFLVDHRLIQYLDADPDTLGMVEPDAALAAIGNGWAIHRRDLS